MTPAILARVAYLPNTITEDDGVTGTIVVTRAVLPGAEARALLRWRAARSNPAFDVTLEALAGALSGRVQGGGVTALFFGIACHAGLSF